MEDNCSHTTLYDLATQYARLSGIPMNAVGDAMGFKTSSGEILTIYKEPLTLVTSHEGTITIFGNLFGHGRLKILTNGTAAYLRKGLEEKIYILNLKATIMNPKNLETAERMAKKRRELQAMLELLTNYVSMASVTVTVPTTFAADGHQHKQATIQSDTFNALMSALVEKEIASIDEFMKSL